MCVPYIWYQKLKHLDCPSLIVGPTKTAVSFGLRGDEVSIKMYQPLAENKNTLLDPMEVPIKLHTLKSGWSIVSLEGS